MTPLELVQAFLDDDDAYDAFIIGRAGTGKSSALKQIVEYLTHQEIDFQICCYTHKACGVVRSKLTMAAPVSTLHSYLKKRPGYNEHATKRTQVNINFKQGESERPTLVIIDEYSMLGENDYMDIVDMQDIEDRNSIKVLYIGDPYQLLPINGPCPVQPCDPYLVTLNKVYRTDHHDLLDIMTNLVMYMDNQDMAKPVESTEHFMRDTDIVEKYKESKTDDKIMVAWTNKAVQRLNAEVQGYSYPHIGDMLFCATTRTDIEIGLMKNKESVYAIETVVGSLEMESKYRTLEHLLTMRNIDFYEVYNHNTQDVYVIAMVFGFFNYKTRLQQYTDVAIEANKEIMRSHSCDSAAVWSRQHPKSPLARRRAKAWRDLLTFKNNVMCVDFPHAQTIHKSQGSTYKEVYIDLADLAFCATKNFDTYLRLFYVALSRTSDVVYTN